jgi:hypothetical protein
MSKLDEAADSWSYNNHTNYDDEDADGFMYCCSRPLAEAGFEAGARWLLEQAKNKAGYFEECKDGLNLAVEIADLESLCSEEEIKKEIL